MQVNVYRNLKPQYRQQRAWSVMAHEGPKRGKVIDIVDAAVVRDARFVVSEASRQRVIREKAKNVHAFVRGELVKTFPLDTLPKNVQGDALVPGRTGWVRVSYDPYHAGHFFRTDNGQPVGGADLVVIAPAGVYAVKPSALRGLRGLMGLGRIADWPEDAPVDGWNG
jgi:hypothetical protein